MSRRHIHTCGAGGRLSRAMTSPPAARRARAQYPVPAPISSSGPTARSLRTAALRRRRASCLGYTTLRPFECIAPAVGDARCSAGSGKQPDTDASKSNFSMKDIRRVASTTLSSYIVRASAARRCTPLRSTHMQGLYSLEVKAEAYRLGAAKAKRAQGQPRTLSRRACRAGYAGGASVSTSSCSPTSSSDPVRGASSPSPIPRACWQYEQWWIVGQAVSRRWNPCIWQLRRCLTAVQQNFCVAYRCETSWNQHQRML